MSEISAYEAQVKKMQGLCEEHNLVYRFHKERYPMTFTIKPSCTMDAQISMLESVEDEGYISPAASMTWIFNDGVLETKVRGGTFTISKTTRTKIENILIKMITFWQQYFFRSVIENQLIPERRMPMIDDEALWPEDAESFGDDDEGDGISGFDEEPEDGEEDTDGNTGSGAGNGASDDGNELPDGDIIDSTDGAPVDPDDPEVKEAARIVRAANKASCALLQRQMGIKTSKASRLMDALETLGVVGPFDGTHPREVLPYDEPDEQDHSMEG